MTRINTIDGISIEQKKRKRKVGSNGWEGTWVFTWSEPSYHMYQILAARGRNAVVEEAIVSADGGAGILGAGVRGPFSMTFHRL